MAEPDHEPISLSALQHWCYCPRQCALIHIAQVFDENVHTLRGQAVHSIVDTPGFETRAGLRIERSLPIWSERLGLVGKADIVEFQSDGTPYPVEYKHGSRRKASRIADCDDMQLAAQALCLEEMTGRYVSEGAIFYASSKRRRVVAIDSELRSKVEQAAVSVHTLLASSRLPAPVNDERCRGCSLVDQCQPGVARDTAEHDLLTRLFDPEA
jgi:CRISPR-associated exonuclease Cas4